MRPVVFAEQNVVFAQGQSEYLALPTHRGSPPEVVVTSCWELSEEDMALLQRNGGKIWLQQLTFGAPLQPQLPSVTKPEHLSTCG